MSHSIVRDYLHIIFAVKQRRPYLVPEIRPSLFLRISEIVSEHHPGSTILACNGVADHIHLLVDLHQSSPLADFVRDVKARTSASLNRANTGSGRFAWQNGYAAFSCYYRETFQIMRYIERQEIHHREENFLNEYVRILRENGIDYANVHPGDRLV